MHINKVVVEMTATIASEFDVYAADVHQQCEFVVIGDPAAVPVQNFGSLLTEDVLLELGEVNESWFTCKSLGIQCSSLISDDAMAPKLDEDDLIQDSRCNPSPVALCSSESVPVQFEELPKESKQRCLSTPPNAGIIQLPMTPLIWGTSLLDQNFGSSNLRHSTPGQLTISLGATMGGHELSWTSSMDTPNLSKSVDNSILESSLIDGNDSRIKPAISKKLFNSQLRPTCSEATPNFVDVGSSEEFGSQLESASSEEFCSQLKRFTTHGNKTKNTGNMSIPSPALHSHLESFPGAHSHLAQDQQRHLEENIAEIAYPDTFTQISSCERKDTSKQPKEESRHNILFDLLKDETDCNKEEAVIVPSDCCPDVSSEESGSTLTSKKQGYSMLQQENSNRGTSVNVSTMHNAVIPSECDFKENTDNLVCDSTEDQCAIAKQICSELPASPEHDLPVTSSPDAFVENGFNSELGEPPKSPVYVSISGLQKEYVQLENMMVPEPVFTENAEPLLIPLTSIKELMPADVELPLGPCAVKVDSGSVETVNFKASTVEQQIKHDNKCVSPDKLLSNMEPSQSSQFDDTFNEKYVQDASNNVISCVCAKITAIENPGPKSAVLESDQGKAIADKIQQKNGGIQKSSSHTVLANFVSEVLDDQDDDIFLNICSHDYGTKLRISEGNALEMRGSEIDKFKPCQQSGSPENLFDYDMESSGSSQQKFSTNGAPQTQMKQHGLTTASVQAIMVSAPAMENAKGLLKEDGFAKLPEFGSGKHSELNKLEKTSDLCHPSPDSNSSGLNEQSANLETLPRQCAKAKSELMPKPLIFHCDDQLVLTSVQENESAIKRLDDFKKPNHIDGSGMVMSRMTSIKTLNKSEHLLADLKHKTVTEPCAKHSVLTVQRVTETPMLKITCKGFSTASGKPVQVSETCLKNAKNVFKDDNLSQLCASELVEFEISMGDKRSSPEGIKQFTSGNQVAIASTKNSPQLACIGFSTASGKPLSVSETALKNAETVFKDDSLSQLCTSEPIEFEISMDDKKSAPEVNKQCSSGNQGTVALNKNQSQLTCKGFSTASGKPLLVSETALKNAKTVFNDDSLSQLCTSKLIKFDNSIDDKNAPEVLKCCTNEACLTFASAKNQPQPACKGISTASEKPVLVSESALKKAESAFKDDNLSQSCTSKLIRFENSDLCGPPNNDCNSASFGIASELTIGQKSICSFSHGFSAASGKALPISKTAFQKARSLFKEDGLSQLCISDLDKRPMFPSDVGKESEEESFHSEKYLSPSCEAAKRTELIKQILTCTKQDTHCQPTASTTIAFGSASKATLPAFSLASGRLVQISKAALEKAKLLFAEESLPLDQTANNKSKSPIPVSSIETASSLSAPSIISEQSAIKGDLHFNDSFENVLITMEDYEDKKKDVHKTTKNFPEFLTASGKGASVSAEALLQAQSFLKSGACCQEGDSSQQFATVPESNSGSGDFGIQSVPEVPNARNIHTVPYQITNVDDNSYKKRTFVTTDEWDQNDSKRLRCNTHVENIPVSALDSCSPSSSALGRVSCGFAMASGKNVAVSKEALQAAKKMFADNEKPELNLQVVPLCPQNGDGSTISEDLLNEDETIITGKNLSAQFVPEVSSNHLVVESHCDHLYAIRNRELSTEIMESTVALLADEMTSTPGRGEKRPCSWLSPIQARPKKLFLYDDSCDLHIKLPKNSVQDNECNAANVKKFCWRSVQTKPVPLEVQQMRKFAVDEQLMSILKRKRTKVSPVPGVLWQKKRLKESKISLRTIVHGKRPERLCQNEAILHGVKTSTLKIKSFNAGEYEFLWEEHYSDAHLDYAGITLGNSFFLIFNEDNLAGKKEFYRAFLDSPGVDSKLIDENWVFNHYRWIVWKLAAMELSFPMLFGGRHLTPEEVMLQLHYRYNCEIDFSQRSALKKILERDDTPAKTMVLCVVRIDEHMLKFDDSSLLDSSAANDVCAAKCIEVTDGWYSIKAVIDNPLIMLVKSGQICIGQKLIVHGAELIGPTEACTPLEAPLNIALKLNANCCRRARWDAKLGYFASPKPFPLPLMSLFSDGGLVGCIHIVVARIYPIQYLEKHDDGTSVVYNDRTNNKAALQFENRKSILMEKIFLDVQGKFHREEKQAVGRSFGKANISNDHIKGLVNGDEIYKVLENSGDPIQIENCLSGTQRTSLTNYKESLLENQRTKFKAEIQKAMDSENEKSLVTRNVIPFLKLRAIGTSPKDLHKHRVCLITLWRPAPDIFNVLKEGKPVCAYYLLAESHSFSSMRENELHLKSTKMTKFEEKFVSDDILSSICTKRKLTPLDSIGTLGFSPQFGEIDIIGLIVHIGYQEQSKFDFMYLADEHLNIAVIKFWGGLKTFGLDGFLKPGVFVLTSNIQWRGNIASSDWSYLYATEFSTFSQNPKDHGYQLAFNQFKNSFENSSSLVEKAKEKISRLVKLRPSSSTYQKLNLGTPFSTSTPLGPSSGSNECTSTPLASVEPVQQRLRQLSKYGTPPPLPNLIATSSPILKSGFRTPTFVTNTKQIDPQHSKIHETENVEHF